jgi:predicted methyltransferase
VGLRAFPPLLTASVARELLGGALRVSLDLGRSEVGVEHVEGGVLLPDGSLVGRGDLERIAGQEGAVFFPRDDVILQVALAGDHFFKLLPTGGAPTVEIDGVRMHRTRGTTPDADAGLKLDALGAGGCRVLDTCAGLGYTALGAAGRGAELVVSMELRPEVLRIAELNPWSGGLMGGDVRLILGDAFHVVEAFPDAFFDCVIHDPPTFSHAGHLYGGEFYSRLSRVLRPGGRLFHYTGEPGSRSRGVDLRRGVMERLRRAGFRGLRWDDRVLGVLGERR